MIRIFIGFDHRQPVSYQVLHHSIMRRASVPVSITPLVEHQLGLNRGGLTPFTYTRYLVPSICQYEGTAVFMDSDMLCLEDIHHIWGVGAALLEDEGTSVAVRMFEGQQQFERPSLMVFNNKRCTELTREKVENRDYHPQSFDWATHGVSALPEQFNRLVGYEDCSDAKILHYTAGVPALPEVEHLGHVDEWLNEWDLSRKIAPFSTLMGNSVHIQNLGIKNDGPAPRPHN